MKLNRKPFQGVLNIIRFNWHFYILSIGLGFLFIYFHDSFPKSMQSIVLWTAIVVLLMANISIPVSFYIYDCSGLYQLDWLPNLNHKQVLNINAGFDETSEIIKNKFPNIELIVCDFYNENIHTEISIKRAREAYPLGNDSLQVSTGKLPFQNHTLDYVLAILSVHEIRNSQERIAFFYELNRITKASGKVYVVEHLRDFSNFIAYTIGFFHFYSRKTWLEVFSRSNLKVVNEIKKIPFITIFILENNGSTP